jgi:hypothetical protein
MPSPTAFTVYAFGVVALFLGISGLHDPSSSLQHLDLPATAAPSVQASSLGAIAVGAFYILAASQENRAFFKLSLVTRTLTTIWALKMGNGWTALGVFEGLGAFGTACTMALGR